VFESHTGRSGGADINRSDAGTIPTMFVADRCERTRHREIQSRGDAHDEYA
jgi:hypothetical protein